MAFKHWVYMYDVLLEPAYARMRRSVIKMSDMSLNGMNHEETRWVINAWE